jgi:hypothetical protein
MKEYAIAHGTDAKALSGILNQWAKQGWVPTHFVMSAGPEVDSFALLLERESHTTSLPIKEDREETPDVH